MLLQRSLPIVSFKSRYLNVLQRENSFSRYSSAIVSLLVRLYHFDGHPHENFSIATDLMKIRTRVYELKVQHPLIRSQ